MNLAWRGVLVAAHLATLLGAERGAGAPAATPGCLSCRSQALLVLVWYRERAEMPQLAAGFGTSRATAYRYRDEAVGVLHAAAPALHDGPRQVAAQGIAEVTGLLSRGAGRVVRAGRPGR